MKLNEKKDWRDTCPPDCSHPDRIGWRRFHPADIGKNHLETEVDKTDFFDDVIDKIEIKIDRIHFVVPDKLDYLARSFQIQVQKRGYVPKPWEHYYL